MYYYKKEDKDIVKYDVTVDQSKLIEQFGIWGQNLNPINFSHIARLINGNTDVIQELLDSEDMRQHNFSKCFTLEEIERMPISKYRRIINFFGLARVPVKVEGIENATSKSRDFYQYSDGTHTRKTIKVSHERLHEIIEHFYLRYGDKCPKIVELLELLEEGDYSVVPEILILTLDKAKEAASITGDTKQNILRDHRFLYKPISNAIRTKEVSSITEDEYIEGVRFLEIDFPLDYVPTFPRKMLYDGISQEIADEDQTTIELSEQDITKWLEILKELDSARQQQDMIKASEILTAINHLPREARKNICRIQYMLNNINKAESLSDEASAKKWQNALDAFVKSTKTI